MKKSIFTLALCVAALLSCPAQPSGTNPAKYGGTGTAPGVTTIDAQDSVVFDLSQAVKGPSYVEFPVSIKSDDIIYALDFSLKYNQIDFTYDTIIDLTSYLQEVFYYNPNDSTLRLTSFSLTQISKNVPLVKIRFMINGANPDLCISDLNTIKGFLNGDACSIKLIECVPLGVDEVQPEGTFSVYPHPASGQVTVSAGGTGLMDGILRITDATGREVYRQAVDRKQAGKPISIDTQHYARGCYQVQLVSPEGNRVRKLILE